MTKTSADLALEAVRRARVKREQAEIGFRASLYRASLEDGLSLRKIASEAGVTHTRVFQIVRDYNE